MKKSVNNLVKDFCGKKEITFESRKINNINEPVESDDLTGNGDAFIKIYTVIIGYAFTVLIIRDYHFIISMTATLAYMLVLAAIFSNGAKS